DVDPAVLGRLGAGEVEKVPSVRQELRPPVADFPARFVERRDLLDRAARGRNAKDGTGARLFEQDDVVAVPGAAAAVGHIGDLLRRASRDLELHEAGSSKSDETSARSADRGVRLPRAFQLLRLAGIERADE